MKCAQRSKVNGLKAQAAQERMKLFPLSSHTFTLLARETAKHCRGIDCSFTHTHTYTHTQMLEEPALSLLPPLEVKLSQYRNMTNKLPSESYSRILWLLRSAILTEEVRKRKRRGEEY